VADLFANGRVVDLILALVVLEAILLVLFRRATGRGVAAGDLLWNLLAGSCLLLALRGALIGAAWPWVALPLSMAFFAHLADLRRRGQR